MSVSIPQFDNLPGETISELFLSANETFPFMSSTMVQFMEVKEESAKAKENRLNSLLGKDKKSSVQWETPMLLTLDDVKRLCHVTSTEDLSKVVPQLPKQFNNPKSTLKRKLEVDQKQTVSNVSYNGKIYPEVAIKHGEKDNKIAFGSLTVEGGNGKKNLKISLDLTEPGRYEIQLEDVDLGNINQSNIKQKNNKTSKINSTSSKNNKNTTTSSNSKIVEGWCEIETRTFPLPAEIIQKCHDNVLAAHEKDIALLSSRIVIDHDELKFSDNESSNSYVHVCCDRCSKWRNLPEYYLPSLFTTEWYCEMHPDPSIASCHVPSSAQSKYANQDDFCDVCYNSGLDINNGILIPCAGPCLRSFHSKCVNPILIDKKDDMMQDENSIDSKEKTQISSSSSNTSDVTTKINNESNDKKSKEPSPFDPDVFDWFCDACLSGKQVCFQCKSLKKAGFQETPTKCPVSSCGKFYHTPCFVGKSMNVIGDNGRSEVANVCGLHVCRRCDEPATPEAPLVQCIRCPIAYHNTSQCCSDRVEMISENKMVCPNHDINMYLQHTKMDLRQVAAIHIDDRIMEDNPHNKIATQEQKKEKLNHNDDNVTISANVQRNVNGYIIFPIMIEPTLCILSFGESGKRRGMVNTSPFAYPIGFKSMKTETSLKHPTKTALYVSDIIDGRGSVIFRVTSSEMPDSPWVGNSPTAVWTQVYNKIESSSVNNSSIGHVQRNVDGNALFGLSHPIVAKLLEDIIKDGNMSDYEFPEDSSLPELKKTRKRSLLTGLTRSFAHTSSISTGGSKKKPGRPRTHRSPSLPSDGDSSNKQPGRRGRPKKVRD